MNKDTLTKARLSDYLEEKVGIDPHLALSIVEHFFEELMLTLEKNESIQLVGLGHFKVIQKKSRIGRNPKTGQEKMISKRHVVKFQVSPTLRKILNQLSLPLSGA